MILTVKYAYHLPLYRQKQIFARENIQIPSSTIEGWTKEALIKLHPLYEQLVFDTKAKGYLQVDETPIKVLDSDKKGAAHQGYYWVYHAPLRSEEHTSELQSLMRISYAVFCLKKKIQHYSIQQ